MSYFTNDFGRKWICNRQNKAMGWIPVWIWLLNFLATILGLWIYGEQKLVLKIKNSPGHMCKGTQQSLHIDWTDYCLSWTFQAMHCLSCKCCHSQSFHISSWNLNMSSGFDTDCLQPVNNNEPWIWPICGQLLCFFFFFFFYRRFILDQYF